MADSDNRPRLKLVGSDPEALAREPDPAPPTPEQGQESLGEEDRPAPRVDGYRHGRVPRAVRERQLLDLAEEQLAEHGYDGLSIEEIARLAGVSRPIVYAHFKDKESLYLACLRRAREELEQMILDATAGARGAREMVELGTNAYFEFVERRGQRWAVLFGGAELSGPGAREITRLRFATVVQIAQLIAAIAPHADQQTREAYAHAISGSAEQVAKWWRENPDLTREEVVAQQVAFAWDGLGRIVNPNSAAS
ncbi:MAG TPA: TetR/AcrR family transcriptional regulator [Solirubrobacteraceae bacterium]|nr:TetR/AcrR family transcriptional regulator [Solirubrobacteraceae bacterium]